MWPSDTPYLDNDVRTCRQHYGYSYRTGVLESEQVCRCAKLVYCYQNMKHGLDQLQRFAAELVAQDTAFRLPSSSRRGIRRPIAGTNLDITIASRYYARELPCDRAAITRAYVQRTLPCHIMVCPSSECWAGVILQIFPNRICSFPNGVLLPETGPGPKSVSSHWRRFRSTRALPERTPIAK